eukprot:1388490-Prymnesium_polylepis.1
MVKGDRRKASAYYNVIKAPLTSKLEANALAPSSPIWLAATDRVVSAPLTFRASGVRDRNSALVADVVLTELQLG